MSSLTSSFSKSVIGFIALATISFGAFFISTLVAHAATIAQTITFTQGDVTYGDTVTLVASVNGTTTSPYFTSTTNSVCTATGTTLNILTAGTCTIVAHADAYNDGTNDYTAAADVQQTFNIAPIVANVTNFTELQAAIADSNIATINFLNDISATQQVLIQRSVTINGSSHTLTTMSDLGSIDGTKHSLFVSTTLDGGGVPVPGVVVNVNSLTIDAAAHSYGVQAYDSATLNLNTVTIKNSKGAGLTVNAATVSATALTTTGNAWGAVNIDYGVQTYAQLPSTFTLVSGTLNETAQIWSDKVIHASAPTTITVNATGYSTVDNAGSRYWTNRIAPTIAVHADVVVEATSPSGATVTYTAPATTDDIDVAGSASCTPASGTTFVLGTTTVSCGATDSSGNHAATTTFSVIVRDTTAPSITLNGSASVNVQYGSTYSDLDASASDAYDGTDTVSASSTVNTTILGDYAVTYTAHDAANNAATPVVRTVHVVQRAVTITADAKTKVYGAADPALTYQITSGTLVLGDTATGTLARATGETVVGSPYAITRGTVALSTNYALTFVSSALTITKANQTITFGALSDKTYSTTAFGVSASTTSGLVVSFGATGACSITGTTVTLTGAGTCSITASQVGDSNYNAASSVLQSFTVAQKVITVSGITANNKVYDGTTAATLTTTSAAFTGVINGDTVTLDTTGLAANFVSKNAGLAQAITVSGLALSGTQGGNYTLTQPTGLTANISKAAVTVTAQADTKVYSGNIASAVAPVVGSLQTGDLVGTAPTQTFDNKNIGIGKTLTASGLVITDGNGGNNYNVSYVTNTAGVITTKSLTVSAAASSKVYNANNVASVVLSDNRISGDVLTVASTSATFSDKNVGSEKTVTVAGISISGTDAGNYSVNGSATATADITARPLTITADAKTKVYGASDPALTYQLTSGALQGSDVFTGTTTRASGENVGTHAITVGTVSAGSNYSVTYVGNNLTVTPAALTVTADNLSKNYGDVDPALTYTHSTLTNSDTDAIFSGSLTRVSGEGVGTKAISQGTLTSGSNYSVTFTPGVFTILVSTSTGSSVIATTSNPDTTISGTVPALTQATSTGGGLSMKVSLEAGTVITGSSNWDGTFTLPVATTTYAIAAQPGTTASATEVIEVGAGDTPLYLDKPAKLTFAGMAGSLIGWSQAGTFHVISRACDSATNPTLPDASDCKIDVGTDLIVWTKHFSTFLTYTETRAPVSNGGGGGSVSGPLSYGYQAPSAAATVNTSPTVASAPTGTVGASPSGIVLGASAYAFTKNQSMGSNGRDVTELQNVLIKAGLLKSKATGTFGPLTFAALKKYQKAHSISQTGTVGPLTRGALNKGL